MAFQPNHPLLEYLLVRTDFPVKRPNAVIIGLKFASQLPQLARRCRLFERCLRVHKFSLNKQPFEIGTIRRRLHCSAVVRFLLLWSSLGMARWQAIITIEECDVPELLFNQPDLIL